MEKIRIVTDTASDIPDQALETFGIEMLSIPIAVDGEGYYERKSFNAQEFYQVLNRAREIPVTSRIPLDDYMACYQKALDDGCAHVINVTINAGGSGIYTAAVMAREHFYEQNPAASARMQIHVVDSRTYSMAYGYPVIEAAKMANEGKTAQEILDYLHDFFDRVEIYLGCYTLEYARKSGRIGAATAFVGDVLGLRPIILMTDGETRTLDKVRGDRNLVPRLLECYQKARQSRDDPVVVMNGEWPEPGAELQALLAEDLGRTPDLLELGASIVINAGPKSVAIVCLGEKR